MMKNKAQSSHTAVNGITSITPITSVSSQPQTFYFSCSFFTRKKFQHLSIARCSQKVQRKRQPIGGHRRSTEGQIFTDLLAYANYINWFNGLQILNFIENAPCLDHFNNIELLFKNIELMTLFIHGTITISYFKI